MSLESLEACRTIVDLSSVTADFNTNDFQVDTYDIYGIQILATGAGYGFDFVIQVTNTPEIPSSWGPRPDTESLANDDTTSPISIEFETGFAYARVAFTNVTGTIGTLKVTKNK